MRRTASPVAALVAAGAFSVVICPAAQADPNRFGPISPDDVGLQCEHQYPENSAFAAGSAYLVAPNDAYSWRCQRVSLAPDGGVITGLGVDLADFCAQSGYAAAIDNIRDANGWRCV